MNRFRELWYASAFWAITTSVRAVVAFASSAASWLRSMDSCSARYRVTSGTSPRARMILCINAQSWSPVCRIWRRKRSSPGGGRKPRLSGNVDGGICATAFAIAWSTARPPAPRPRARPPTMTLWKSPATFSESRRRTWRASLRSLPYAKARSWSVPSVSTRSFDCPSRRSPSRHTTTTSNEAPTKATRSFAWTPAGRRPTARTSGFSAGLRSRSLVAAASVPVCGTSASTPAQGFNSVVLPTMFVISQRPSTLATS